MRQQLLPEVFRHDPQDPTGGDYMRYQYGSVTYSASWDGNYFGVTIAFTYFTTARQEAETEQAAASAGSGGRTVMLEPLIKRVIAVGGDTLSIEDGQVYLNGELLSEPYLNQTTPAFELSGTVTVPEGHVFVMGDNRWDSHDSRWNDIGFVEVGDIVGKVFWRIWPLSSFGAV